MSSRPAQSLRERIVRLNSLGGGQKIALMLAIALSVAIVWVFWLASGTREYRPLYANISDRDGGAILAALETLGIPYRTEAGGAVSVPATRLNEARLRLAAQGLPKGDSAGFELLDNSRFGSSQFAEQVKYQRALEGELKRSIELVDAVENARVHLAMPRTSAFLREQQQPSASVLLTLHDGRKLDAAQVGGIVQLVASSVPGLVAARVAVVDSSGALLGTPSAAVGEAANSQVDYANSIERAIVRRIEDILTPLIGPNSARVQVSAEVEAAPAERLEAGNEPGRMPLAAAANQPVEAGGNPNIAPPPPPTVSSSVRRISVAMVLDNKRIRSPAGDITSRAWTAAEMAQLKALVQEASGFDASRGDTLNIVNSPFVATQSEPRASLAWWQDPVMVELGRDLARYGVLLLLVIFLITVLIRPLLREFVRRPAPIMPVPETSGGTYRDQYEEPAVAQHHPREVANVIKGWMRENE